MVGFVNLLKAYLAKDKCQGLCKKLVFIYSLFVNTYVCEQHFSRMKLVKSQLRLKIADEHLQKVLRDATSSVQIGLNTLCSAKRCKVPHS